MPPCLARPPRESGPHQPGTMGHAVIGAGRSLAGASQEPAGLRPEDCIAYPGGIPHIRDALEPGPTEVMALEHV